MTAAVDAVGRAIDARDFQNRGVSLYPLGLKSDLVSGARPALLVLGFAGVFLVLVLMVNVATLLLARASKREQEFAVSRALGANGAALMRATMLEGGLLGLIGGVGGALVGIWGTRAFVALAPLDLPRRESVVLDWGVGAVVIGVGALLGLLAARGAGAVGGPHIAGIAACQQRGTRRRRTPAHATRHGRRAGGAVARSAQRRRARGPQLRAAAPRQPGIQSPTVC